MLVIGGSSGIGEAVARQAAQSGALVTIAARRPERLQQALQRLPQGVGAQVLDMEDAPGVHDFFAGQDPWDHVVVAGSSTRSAAVRDLGLQDARAAMDNKFWGAYHVARSARIAPQGSLTLVSGVYSQRPVVSAVLQGAINAALEALMRGLALELAPAQVRVNAVSPSTTATPLWDRLGPEGRQQKFDTMAARLPVGRVAAPDEIAQVILLAATNRFMTGSTLLVDGGDSLV